MKSTAKLLTAVAVGAMAAVPIAATAAPAPAPGTYVGNHCLASDGWFNNTGVQACYFRNTFALNRYVAISLGAYDSLADGYSAKADVTVQQWTGNGWVNTHVYSPIINSAGAGRTRVGPSYAAYRSTGATHFRFLIRACTYNAPTATHVSCRSAYTPYYSWTTGR